MLVPSLSVVAGVGGIGVSSAFTNLARKGRYFDQRAGRPIHGGHLYISIVLSPPFRVPWPEVKCYFAFSGSHFAAERPVAYGPEAFA